MSRNADARGDASDEGGGGDLADARAPLWQRHRRDEAGGDQPGRDPRGGGERVVRVEDEGERDEEDPAGGAGGAGGGRAAVSGRPAAETMPPPARTIAPSVAATGTCDHMSAAPAATARSPTTRRG